jgi:hypothetical protein
MTWINWLLEATHNALLHFEKSLFLQQQLISTGFVRIRNKQQWDPSNGTNMPVQTLGP